MRHLYALAVDLCALEVDNYTYVPVFKSTVHVIPGCTSSGM